MTSAHLLLRRLLDQAGGAEESGYMLVLDGEGFEQLPEEVATPKGVHRVRRVTTEIGLRHLLWQAKGAPLIVVMPPALAQQIQQSPDLLRRARNERVQSLSLNDVLEVLLGVRVVGADVVYVQQLALEHVDRLSLSMSRRTLPTVIDRKLLTELLVDVSVGEHVRRSSPAQLLATWVMDPPQWSEKVNQLVRDALPLLHGDDGRLLAWALEDPTKRLRELVVHGAVLTVEVAEVPKQVWGPLWKAAAEPPVELDRRILRRNVARLAEEALTILGDSAGALLDEASTVGRMGLVPEQLQTSRVLPLAFSDRCYTLAQRAAAGKAIMATEIEWLASHRAARLHPQDLTVIECLGRLSRYLDDRTAPRRECVELIKDYQRSGAFADLAMLQLRAALASSERYHDEASKVVAACRARRDRDNLEFAKTLAAGYESCLHRDPITPLHRLWRRTVAPMWQQEPRTRLLLIVLDGCSYPVFLHLLYDLAQDSTFPLGLRPDAEGQVAGLPALAPLPTITSHARGAIFLGELPNDPLVAETVFREQDEAKTDKARFNQNAALGERTRRLFLKGDLADGGQALRAALEDEALDVVAVVFNAVDDQIGSANIGAAVRIAADDIIGFKPALRVALQQGRRVLLTADHGHTPWVDKNRRAGAGKTARYLPLATCESPPEGFLEIDVAGLGGPPQRRAFGWQSGAYLGSPQVGFHGGCSLEEMVVPLGWIERGGLQCDEPAWWYGRGAISEPRAAAPVVSPPLTTPLPSELPPPAKPQLSLFDPADKINALGLQPELVATLSIDEKSVLVLLHDAGSARATELAERLKKNPGRFNGLMVQLRRKLHAAACQLFIDEQLPTGEIRYRYTRKEGR